MVSIGVDVEAMAWSSATAFYGPQAVYDGKDVIQLKVLRDRRTEGGGIAWIVRFLPPPGKLIKIVAVARSDEHILSILGGRSTKTGRPTTPAGGYGLNTTGQPHSAMISAETVSLVVYRGEPDEIRSLEIVDLPVAN